MSIVLTGATAGLGLKLLERLVKQEPAKHYVVLARDLPKARRNFVQIEARLKLNGGSIDVVYADHANMGSLFVAAEEVKQLTDHIDALFLNAGTMGKCSLNYFRQTIAFLRLRVFAALTCDATMVILLLTSQFNRIFRTLIFNPKPPPTATSSVSRPIASPTLSSSSNLAVCSSPSQSSSGPRQALVRNERFRLTIFNVPPVLIPMARQNGR